jgi:hypothetical protein
MHIAHTHTLKLKTASTSCGHSVALGEWVVSFLPRGRLSKKIWSSFFLNKAEC